MKSFHIYHITECHHITVCRTLSLDGFPQQTIPGPSVKYCSGFLYVGNCLGMWVCTDEYPPACRQHPLPSHTSQPLEISLCHTSSTFLPCTGTTKLSLFWNYVLFFCKIVCFHACPQNLLRQVYIMSYVSIKSQIHWLVCVCVFWVSGASIKPEDLTI